VLCGKGFTLIRNISAVGPSRGLWSLEAEAVGAMTLLGPSVHELHQNIFSTSAAFLLSSPSVVLFNTAFLCHKQIRADLPRSHISDYLPPKAISSFAYEKFGVLFNSPRPFPHRGEGVLVCPRGFGVISRLQLASEKQGQVLSIYPPRAETRWCTCHPMGEPLRRLCVLRA
jgi:hypothetical protein